MVNLRVTSFRIPSSFFLTGILFVVVGINGEQLAIAFSKPDNSTAWSTSDSLINSFIYIPLVIGISLIITSIITFSVAFYIQQAKRSE